MRWIAVAVVAAALALAGTAPAAHAATVASVPSSIDATGRLDVTDQLNTFFASRPANSTVALPRGARYRVEGVLSIVGAQGLTIEGNDATLVATTDGSQRPPPALPSSRAHWPRLRRHVAFSGGDHITVRNLVVQGPNAADHYVPALEGQAGFAFTGSQHIVLDGVTVRHVYGDGVYVAGGTAHVDIARSVFGGIGRQGLAFVSGQDVAVHDSTFGGVARSVIDVEPLGQGGIAQLRVTHNTITGYVNYLFSEGGSPRAAVTDVSFDSNAVRGGNGLSIAAGVRRARRSSLRFVNNTSSVPGRAPPTATQREPIALVNLSGVVIQGNSQPMAGGTVISLDGVCNAVITANVFTGAAAVSRTVAPCGALPIGNAAPAQPPRAPRVPRTPARPTGKAQAPRSSLPKVPSRPASNDAGWLIAGALAGVLAALGLARLIALRRATPPEAAP